MRKALRRAASLVVAGTLAGGTAALAQTSPYLDSPGATRNPAPALRSPAAAVRSASPAIPTPSDPSARLAEVRVEVAWLADPVTFPFALTAHAFGSNLELHGTVPNEVVRSHALKIAREHSTLAVADVLHVQPDMHLPPAGAETSERLARAASATLKQTLPRYAMGFEVYARPEGMIILKGPVPSYEEKLLASQHLRALHGCTSVDNQLEVLTVHLDGKTYVAVSADGSQLAQYDPRMPHPTAPLALAAHPEPARTPTVPPRPMTQQVAVNTFPRTTVQTVSAPSATMNPGVTRADYVQPQVARPTPKPAVSAAAPEAALRRRIELTCGTSARDIEVIPQSNASYLVRLKVRNTQTGEWLGRRILDLPELQPYGVVLAFQIVP